MVSVASVKMGLANMLRGTSLSVASQVVAASWVVVAVAAVVTGEMTMGRVGILVLEVVERLDAIVARSVMVVAMAAAAVVVAGREVWSLVIVMDNVVAVVVVVDVVEVVVVVVKVVVMVLVVVARLSSCCGYHVFHH